MKFFRLAPALLLLLFCTDSFAELPLRIELSTAQQLRPLYLGTIQRPLNESTETSNRLPSDYLRQLEAIALFDFDHNGKTAVVPDNAMRSKLFHGQVTASAPWREQQVSYVVRLQLSGRKLSAQLLAVESGKLFELQSQEPLSGDLSRDRIAIHKIADAIFSTLFGRPGIATTRILYADRQLLAAGRWSSDLYEVDWDGGNLRCILQQAGYCVMPTYLPPAEQQRTGSFAFVSYQEGIPKIYGASLSAPKPQRLIEMRGNQLMPAFSRQRDRLAFICDLTSNPELYVVQFSPEKGCVGTPQLLFRARYAVQGSPTFSPDGKKIAFVSNKEGSPKVYLVDLQTKDVSLLTRRHRESSAPAWSPDGTKIAYCAMTDSTRQIWYYDLEKRQEVCLTEGSGHKENPSWAPDSQHLVYNRAEGEAVHLWVVSLYGKEYQLTKHRGEQRFPCWEVRNGS